ncbi:MAG: hypothetical protein CMJ83_19735 [Planctomycetes bacterium]|nr:hypothetical protein [Planctomycetota bacterium]
MAELHPTDADLPDDRTLRVSWSDEQITSFPLDLLRSRCPCAQCVDEWTGEVRVSRSMFPDIGLKGLEEVGSYAFRITFTDGHSDGLFTWPKLRALADESARAAQDQR